MDLLIFIFGVIAVIAGIVAVVMVNVKKYSITDKPALIPGIVCLVSLVLFIILYAL